MPQMPNTIPFRKSLQAKPLIGVATVIFVISVFVYIVVPLVAEQKMTDEMIKHTKGIGSISASSVSSALYFEDQETIEKVVQDIREYDEVRYIAVLDTTNAVVYETHKGKYSAGMPTFPNQKDEYRIINSSIILKKAIIQGKKSIGFLLIEVSLRNVQKEIKQFRATIAWFVLVLFIFSIVAVILLFRPIMRRLKSLVNAAESITNGAFTERAPTLGNDEISHLAIAFNTMVDSVVRLYNDISYTNSNLEKIVEERTAALMNEVEVRKLTEENLIVARNKAEESNRTKSAFLASMSHELRTPLNSIIGFAQILREDEEVTARNKHYLDMMYRSGAHLLDLINDILDISKIEAGQLDLYPEQSLLADIVESVRSIFSVKAAEKDLLFIINLDTLCPISIITDARRLRQVLINLIGNAIKFTDKGSVKLLIEVVNVSPEDKTFTLLFRVIDTGRGIDQSQMDRIFKPFMQQSSRYSEGTGLGLAISSKIIEKMGGNIHIKSGQNQGTEFYFELTIESPDFSQEIIEHTDDNHRVSLEKIIENQNLVTLIVDDVVTNRVLLSVILESIGFECHEAENGKQAIEMIESLNPSIVFMDLMMPIMDGKEAVDIIRNTMNNQTLPIIAVTADVMTSTKESLLEIGFNDVVSKPFTIDQIHATIAQCVHIDSDKTLENDNGNTEAHIDIENDKELTIHSIVSYLLTLPHNQKEALFAAMELQDFDEMLRIGNTEITPTLSMSTILKRFQSAAELYDYKFFSKLLEEYSRNKS
jgi:signal transduction histidine kinase/CheY-like chemotaxis protein